MQRLLTGGINDGRLWWMMCRRRCFFSADVIAAGEFRLSFCGFPQEVEEVLDPFELMSRYEQEKVEASVRIEKILAEIQGILERK